MGGSDDGGEADAPMLRSRCGWNVVDMLSPDGFPLPACPGLRKGSAPIASRREAPMRETRPGVHAASPESPETAWGKAFLEENPGRFTGRGEVRRRNRRNADA
ncbi:hypothetical protein GCM10017600_61310 [Streptosporangium carneum]|uniref:Uncharacterized protein n=1 Tax=Streptosporangium carneum TaxID=47481 RepID=A0A9W6I651_9ACTN|nr:hypothetical protein GCM10017600_61310 [Streptosporangium carneum]